MILSKKQSKFEQKEKLGGQFDNNYTALKEKANFIKNIKTTNTPCKWNLFEKFSNKGIKFQVK